MNDDVQQSYNKYFLILNRAFSSFNVLMYKCIKTYTCIGGKSPYRMIFNTLIQKVFYIDYI